MVRRDTFLNKIRELGYSYKSQAAKTQIYKKNGGSHRIFLRMTELLEDEYVKNTLRQAGLSHKEIQEFLASARIGETGST